MARSKEDEEFHRQFNARQRALNDAGDAYKREVVNGSLLRLFLVWPIECLFRVTYADEQMLGFRISERETLKACLYLVVTVVTSLVAYALSPALATLGLGALALIAWRQGPRK